MATIKHSAADLGKSDTTPQKPILRTQTNPKHQNPSATRAAKCTKPQIVDTEPTRQTTPGKENENSPFQLTRSVNNPYPSRPPRQKTKLDAPTLWGKVDTRAYTIEDPPIGTRKITECNEEPTQDLQCRWNVGMILRHNARHPEDQTTLPQCITESPDNYATLKRHLPKSKTERIYIYDMDYKCDPWDEPTIYDTDKLSFKIQVSNRAKSKGNNKIPIITVANSEKDNTISDSTRHHYVHTNRCRKHYLHRRRNNMGATGKRTTRKRRFSLITTKISANHSKNRQR